MLANGNNVARDATPRPRVLVADDQDDVLVAIELLLKGEGIVADRAQSPRDVLRAVEARPYDLLLLDMNYGSDTTSGAEGLALLAEIRKYDRALPVVLMTAWATVELAVEAMRSGSRDFIIKPWDNQKLLETIYRSLIVPGKDGSNQGRDARLRGQVQEARSIQRRLLPTELPSLAGCEIHGSWHPATGVGGDYYDAIQLVGGRIAFCIADVSGKGLPAALLMANVQAAVRAAARSLDDAASVCRRVNRVVYENTPAEKFVSFFYGVLDVYNGRLRYSNAGHPPPVVLNPDDSMFRLEDGGLVLGLFADTDYQEAEVSLGHGHRVVLYTDGLTEAENGDGEEFGDRRLIDLILKNRSAPSQALHDSLLHAARNFAGSLEDDATVLTVTLGGSGDGAL